MTQPQLELWSAEPHPTPPIYQHLTPEQRAVPVSHLACLILKIVQPTPPDSLPVGLLWGEGEGQATFHPDQAVPGAIRTVFEKFAELGSARQVWLWFQSQGLSFPHQRPNGEVLWIKPTYIAIHAVLRKAATGKTADTHGLFNVEAARRPRSGHKMGMAANRPGAYSPGKNFLRMEIGRLAA